MYSLLSETKIREEAKAMGLEDMLKYSKDSASGVVLTQLDFLIKQLNTDEEDDGTASEDGEEADDFEEVLLN